MKLKEGDTAPYFEMCDQDENLHKLTDHEKLVLYFYPKDDTPGCTTEACGFRDDSEEFRRKGIMVFGVSNDTVISHKKFSAKYSLNFPILSDVDKSVSEAYGVYGEKNFMGRISFGIKRMTFLIEKGTIKKIYEKVDVKNHSREVLKEFNE